MKAPRGRATRGSLAVGGFLRNSCVTTPRYFTVQDGTQRNTVSAAQRRYQWFLAALTRRRSGVRAPQRPLKDVHSSSEPLAFDHLFRAPATADRRPADFDASRSS